MIWFLLFISLCFYVTLRFFQTYLNFSRQFGIIEKLPGPPLTNKFLGNVEDMMVPTHDMPAKSYEHFKKYGSIFRVWIVGYPFIGVAEAKYTEILFTSKATEIKPFFYRFLYIWLGLGLLTSTGQLWQQRRKLITPAFHFSILSDFCEVFVSNTLTLIHQLRQNPDGTLINVMTQMKLVTLDNICETAMGIKIDALNNPNHNFIRAVEEVGHVLMNRMSKPWLWNDFLFFLSPGGRKHWADLKTIFELTEKAIKNRRNERQSRSDGFKEKCEEAEGFQKMAFLDLLLEACETNSVRLTDEDLRDEVNTFMFEGHDTTAVSMGFTLFLLGCHPEIQEKCHQELCDIFQNSDRKPTVADLQKMKYLEQVIKETLRLFPSVPMLGREVAEDLQLGDYIAPKGSILSLNVCNLHRNPEVFPDPEKFDPDRFSPEQSSGRHPYAYVPFAAGARNCIGQKFALMEEKVVLSYILRNFLLESEHGLEELKISFALVIRSQNDVNVKFTRRLSSEG